MKIALVTDEYHPINQHVREWLENRNYKVELFGSYKTQKEENWINVTTEAARNVSKGLCQEGIFFCWSGTGAAIIANKISSIRAALCNDAETAKIARVWNDANILVLSNRTLTKEMADNILETWFMEYERKISKDELKQITDLELS